MLLEACKICYKDNYLLPKYLYKIEDNSMSRKLLVFYQTLNSNTNFRHRL